MHREYSHTRMITLSIFFETNIINRSASVDRLADAPVLRITHKIHTMLPDYGIFLYGSLCWNLESGEAILQPYAEDIRSFEVHCLALSKKKKSDA